MNPMSEQEFQDYLRQANWFMRGQMDENRKAFQLDSFHRFDWDQWRGELVFSSGGTPKVVARIQIAGSLSAKSNLWVWAWANPGYLASVRQAALRTKEFGTERGIVRLIQPRWAAKESDAWEMTALAAKLSEAKGAYRCPGPEGSTFMVFTDIRAVSDRRHIFGAQTCSHVLEEDQPILLVSRELDGEVLAVCGGENDSAATGRNLPLDRLLDLDPSLAQLADMPDGWVALRESPDHEWIRSKAE
ncbi:MAG TPA: hypothetical protein VKU80_09730 [Planctomycetota bacterium]|nr:hypothetical protein [Planctomycetota bacterium]